MPPTYPHPVPHKSMPFVLDVAVAARVDKLPDPMRLTAHVAEWAASVAPGVTATSLINFAAAGSILVLGNGGAVKDPDVQQPDTISKISGRVQKGRLERGKVHGASADILNGDLSNMHLKASFGAYKQQNAAAQSGLPASVVRDPSKLIIQGDDSLMTYSQSPAGGGTSSAQWDYRNKRILINAHVEDGSMVVHEYFHTFDLDGEGANTFGWAMDEGFTDFFARDVAARYTYPYKGNWGYENGYQAVKAIVDSVGLDRICRLYFERDKGLVSKVSDASHKISGLAFQMGAGELNPSSALVKKELDAFIAGLNSWTGWPKKTWTVNVPVNPFRSAG